jgi:hypothetical protein
MSYGVKCRHSVPEQVATLNGKGARMDRAARVHCSGMLQSLAHRCRNLQTSSEKEQADVLCVFRNELSDVDPISSQPCLGDASTWMTSLAGGPHAWYLRALPRMQQSWCNTVLGKLVKSTTSCRKVTPLGLPLTVQKQTLLGLPRTVQKQTLQGLPLTGPTFNVWIC